MSAPARASRRMWRGVPLTVALLATLAVVTVPSAPAQASTGDEVDVAAIDRLVLDGLDRAGIPGAAIAITRGREVLHLRGYGRDSRGEPVSGDTPFRIASLSKAFTALAVLQLVDAERLALDDTVAAHLPEFRVADWRGSGITVRQLLDQTSGLADREVPDLSRPQPRSLTEATARLRSARLVADPGTEFNYHNPNYQVAARLVEAVSGERFDRYLEDHVFLPAGMNDSSTTISDDDEVPGLADGHVVAYGRPVALAAPGDFLAGAGGVVSTAADMAEWLIVQANDGVAADGTRLVSGPGMTEMHTPRGISRYALGWAASGPARAPALLEHNGNVLTFSSATAILPATRTGVTVMFNGSSGLLLEQSAILAGVLRILEGGDPLPGAPLLSSRTLDGAFSVLTFASIALGLYGVATSRRRAARLAGSPLLALAQLLPVAGVLAVVQAVPDLVGGLLGGRDLTWITITYGSPALAVLACAAAGAAAATLVATAWHRPFLHAHPVVAQGIRRYR